MSIDGCFAQTVRSAWKAFWGNIGKPQFKSFSFKLKKRRIETLVLPILKFRMTRWPWTLTKANSLDQIRRKLYSVVLLLKPHSDESWECFTRRKRRILNFHIPVQKRWSVIWAQRIVQWHQHVLRNTNNHCWSHRIYSLRSAQELHDRRVASGVNRPQVRAQAGFSAMRWSESIYAAYAFLFKHDL